MVTATRQRTIVVVLMVAVPCVPAAVGQTDELTQEAVNQSIDLGVQFLRQAQNRRDGSWPVYGEGYRAGVTSLCTLAMLNSGVPPTDPAIQKALDYLRRVGRPQKTYGLALQTMVFAIAEPETDRLRIQRNVARLESIQVKQGTMNGAWGYDEASKGDLSNTQFAVLALHEAERAGVKVNETTWRRAENFWKRWQIADGSWKYDSGFPKTGSMACAGIASLVITSGMLSKGDASVTGQTIQCCGQQVHNDGVQRGIDWLANHFSVQRNPGMGRQFLFYYLYALERVGRFTGRRFIGGHDWYREGADFLLSRQDRLNGSWTGLENPEKRPDLATAYALLFLSKGRRPVAVGKLKRKPDTDWNYHRSDVANLTRYIESKWKQDLTWQTIDMEIADAQDLWQAPVLFLSGQYHLNLTEKQKDDLKAYIYNGGFLFAEACCDGKGFDFQFRSLMEELFPDNPLEPLPPDHPIWYAEETVDPRFARPLWGINACCRTSVVYCPEGLSCYWELSGVRNKSRFPESVIGQIAAANAMGANVVTYATNRQLREKLDIPEVIRVDQRRDDFPRATLQMAKVRHSGGSNDAPAALVNLLRMLEEHAGLRVSLSPQHLPASDPSLPDFPILYIHGRGEFRWSSDERKQLATYLTNGGTIVADAICAAEPFARSFRREMQRILPQHPLRRIAPSHPMFSDRYGGYDVTRVTISAPRLRTERDSALSIKRDETAPYFEGIDVDGRYVVIFSPYDLSCALENHASLQCKGYVREDAARLGVNIIMFALQQ